MRPFNVLPWLSCEKCKVGTIDPLMLAEHADSPFDALAVLLADIEGTALQKQRIVQVYAPRAVVFHGQGEPAYLYRYQSPYGFASFALDAGGILTVLPRYNDPMDPQSGCRKGRTLLSGWQGVAEILESAVRRSRDWKNFQTIETNVEHDEASWFDDTRVTVTYEVWATPRSRRILQWCEQLRDERPEEYIIEGFTVMVEAEPVLLARATVIRRVQDDGLMIEEVVRLNLYPKFAGRVVGYDCGCDRGHVLATQLPEIHNCTWRSASGAVCQPGRLLPVKVDMRHQQVMRFTPHDELKLTLNWA